MAEGGKSYGVRGDTGEGVLDIGYQFHDLTCLPAIIITQCSLQAEKLSDGHTCRFFVRHEHPDNVDSFATREICPEHPDNVDSFATREICPANL